MAMLSERDALRVADAFAADAVAVAPDEVVAVVLIGSLGGGAYVPGRSDIDTAVVVTNSAGDHLFREFERLAAGYAARHAIPKGFGVVPIKVDQLYRPPEPRDELAPELLDIGQRGRLLAGELDLSAVRQPTAADLLAYCRVFIPWLRSERRDPARPAANQTMDAEINGLLYELRLTVLSSTGRYVLPKRAVIPTLLDAHPGKDDEPQLLRIQRYLEGAEPLSRDFVTGLRDGAEWYNENAVRW